ncbi:cytochrome ubiquinol oxidase subunit I [Deinococcus maricopensis]|uniref:Cytochrome bd ubiquinol oxidase subunit I n=1 Tax=Deinococcus maricopensis (strain DSM 21211 / LMG 22137 / NRRL B-23946 / LB-34) TaxID=709986 RepID=E8U7E0_DEIML|nr:cytochrome ubiquinol oxidase subunit I [Deinococcus maricopensis]ADV66979.1 cytochrome bd ubiquinol oxidase subunit I [Deinococcus maricopensis DSM 21211]
MDALDLSRFQFATTSIFHFFFVPFTVGLAMTIAVLQTLAYVTARRGKRRSDDAAHDTPASSHYEQLTRFFGHLFLINFAVGVVTGIVQEFQFGMNWAGFSNFVGNIFGVPLALEVLMAFFLESTFLGLWWFGREKLPTWANLGAIWLVAIGSTISAYWIIIANAWMQHPVGYEIERGQAVLTSFWAVMTNPKGLSWFAHIWFGGLTIAAFFVLAVSGYHLLRKHHTETFRLAQKVGLIIAAVGSVGVAGVGHLQGQSARRDQPMKFAAFEAIWETTHGSTGESLIALPSNRERRNLFNLEVPYVGSILAYNRPTGGVQGINDLQKAYEAKYGPGNYIPPVWPVYWAFRIMVGCGLLMLFMTAWGLWRWRKGTLDRPGPYLKFMFVMPLVPHVANFTGFITTEMGRQPWIVQGLLRTRDAVSALPASTVVLSLVAFWVAYLLLIGLDVYLLTRTARAGLHAPDVQARDIPAPAYPGDL